MIYHLSSEFDSLVQVSNMFRIETVGNIVGLTGTSKQGCPLIGLLVSSRQYTAS